MDKERRQRYFTKDDTEVLDNLRKRLAKRINSFLRSSGKGNAVTATRTNESVNTEKLPEIPVEDPPTFFEIVSKSPKEVYPNKTFSVKFKTDAHPNYFAQADTFVAFIEPQSFGMFTGTARIVEGYGLAYFKVSEETEIGEKGSITLELRPPRQKSLRGEIDLVAVAIPENSDPEGKGNDKTPNIQVEYIYKHDDFYKERDWDENSVAEVAEGEDALTIFVSGENKNLNKLVVKAQRHSSVAVDNIKNKYLEHISFYAFMLKKSAPEIFTKDMEVDLPEELLQKMQQSELSNASETICGMINDFFEPIITESVEKETEETVEV